MSDYGKMGYPTAVPENKEEVKLLGKPVEGTKVQIVEVSLTDDTINKLARELAKQINLLGVYR